MIRILISRSLDPSLLSLLKTHYSRASVEERSVEEIKVHLQEEPSAFQGTLLILSSADVGEAPSLWDTLPRGSGVLLYGDILPDHPSPRILELIRPSSGTDETIWRILRAVSLLEQELHLQRLLQEERIREERLNELHRIGMALTAERDLKTLLELIVSKAREFTGADAGSLYLVERDSKGDLKETMIFLVAQNDSVPLDFRTVQLPINPSSIAGYVALTGEIVNLEDAYEVPPNYPFQFNRSFDEKTGYRTRSILAIPLKDRQGRVIGVLQLINKKKDPTRPLSLFQNLDEGVLPFSQEDEQLLLSLGGQSAVAIENAQLYQDIHRLFESFIRASVQAIEARDPTTRGHSERVAVMTRALAECVDRIDTGPLAPYRFTRTQIQEIYYAGLLHDFGKIGVREHVLVKAKKLYPYELEEIRFRFRFIDRIMKLKIAREGIELYRRYPKRKAEAILKEREKVLREELERLQSYLEIIERANEPTVLPQDVEERLRELLDLRVEDPEGEEIPLLKPKEFYSLSVPRGSLTEEERKEIESHVTYTYQFLSLIPWTQELRGIPEIAYGHHEKLDGSGYPRKVRGEAIPIQTRMMTISDIYDALTAGDRPYKKALPPERALEILEMEVKEGKLDSDLFKVFLEAEIYKKVLPRGSG
jgi:HD-GYP domain-containing protein (c-di-GMP phosphodiesterase class II)